MIRHAWIACPVDCIHPKKDESEFEDAPQLYIDPQEGIDCGACVPVCPVSAILALDDLPTQGLGAVGMSQTCHFRKCGDLLDHLVGAAEQREGKVRPSVLALFKLITNSTL